PSETSDLIGRETQVATALELLRRTRLLTLLGPGGVGKTRLALRLAHKVLAADEEAVYFVSLAPVSDERVVASALVQALGLKAGRDPARGHGQALIDHLALRRSLLVVDNFEHLISAAPFIEGLLTEVPQLSIVVTSRASLNLPSELQYRVPPLEVRSAKGATQ